VGEGRRGSEQGLIGADGEKEEKEGCRGAERVQAAVGWCVGPRRGSEGFRVCGRGKEGVQAGSDGYRQ
jgi:hypothetical protein